MLSWGSTHTEEKKRTVLTSSWTFSVGCITTVDVCQHQAGGREWRTQLLPDCWDPIEEKWVIPKGKYKVLINVVIKLVIQ